MRFWMVGLLAAGVAAVVIGCAPSAEELRAMVQAEVQAEVAKIVVPPGPQGAEGVQGVEGAQGPQGLQGATGEQGQAGPRGDRGEQGPTGQSGPAGAAGAAGPPGASGAQGPAGPMGPPGSSGAQVAIPKVLEVEELIVRAKGGCCYLSIGASDTDSVVSLNWYNSGGFSGQIFAGSTVGMMLANRSSGAGWTEVCIDDGSIGLCPK